MSTNVVAQPTLHISKGNSKTGAIPSFSLPSGKTCSAQACKTCYAHGCYARKIEKLRPSVRNAYNENMLMMTEKIDQAEQELNAYFDLPNSPKLFRIHVSGDFFSGQYFEMWMRIIQKHPTTQFLAFTKQKDIILPYIGELPGNLSLVWSAWPSTPVPAKIRKALSVAWMQDGTENRVPKRAVECAGNCETCAKCWALAERDVVFKKH